MSEQLKISLDDASYAPGETVTGTIAWSLDTSPKDGEIRLLWFTEGKGDMDSILDDLSHQGTSITCQPNRRHRGFSSQQYINDFREDERCSHDGYWRFKSRPKGGRPRIDPEVRKLIREMWNTNPTRGRPRIQAELAKLGITASDSTVAR